MADTTDGEKSWWDDFTSTLGNVGSSIGNFFTSDDGNLDWRNIATVGGGIAGALGLFDGEAPKVGYQGKIPRYKMIRDQVQYDDSARRPGSGGRRYLSRPRYATADNVAAAEAESKAEAQAFADAQAARQAEEGMARGGLATIQRFANGGMPQGMPQGTPPMPNMAKQAPNMLMGANPAARPPMGGQGTPPNRPTGIAGVMPPKLNNPTPQRPPQGMGMPKPPQMGGAPQMPMGAKPPMPPQMPPQQGAGRMEPEDVLASLAATGKVQPMPQPAPIAPQMPVVSNGQPQGLGAIQRFAQGGQPMQGMYGAQTPMDRPSPMAPPQQQGQPRYLGGPTDGMADRIPANIDGQQPAALSDGEFVIPADVVSHLGNGNSNAGANQLYNMMERVRKARTGNTEQGRQINPNQFMPRG